MLLITLLVLPLIGIYILLCQPALIEDDRSSLSLTYHRAIYNNNVVIKNKNIALFISLINFILSLFLLILFDSSFNQYQFVLESPFE